MLLKYRDSGHSQPSRDRHDDYALVRSYDVACGRAAAVVVTGIAPDKVTVAHPTPKYPRLAPQFGVNGSIRITVKVQNGKIVETSASSDEPMIRYEARQWIVRCWKCKPEVTGVFTIPINYKRQA